MDLNGHRIFLSICFLISLFVASAQRSPAVEDQERGIASPHPDTGVIVITPQFVSAGPFSEGLAAVQIGDNQDGKWGYIDKSGRFAIDPQFDRAEAFSEGLAAVRSGDDKTGKWGFIDKSGKYVITPQWDHVTAFSGGLSVVRTGNIVMGKDRVIDKQGRYASDLKSGVILPCENGMTLVGINVSWVSGGVNRHFGFVDKSGHYVINPVFDDAFCFTEGMAAVRTGGAEAGGWGFIDTTGRFVIPPQWGSVYPFNNGIATVATSGGLAKKWGAIDRTGQTIIPQQFPEPLIFHDGLALEPITTYTWVTDQRGRSRVRPDTTYSFINKNGTRSTGLQWRSASSFSQGLAPVMLDESPACKWGYVDQSGRYRVSPQYLDAQPFSEGMAAVLIGVEKKGKWGYIAR